MEKSLIKRKEEYDILNEEIKQAKCDATTIEIQISQKRKELRRVVSKLHTLQIKAKKLREP